MTETVRVLLLEVPQLLRGILEHAIEMRGDCTVVRSAHCGIEPELEQRVTPDVVILGLTAAEDCTLVPALFARWPSALVMTVTQAGDETTAWELRPRRRSLGQMSPDEMVSALQARARPSRERPQE